MSGIKKYPGVTYWGEARKKLSGNAGKLFFHSMEKEVEEYCLE